MQIKLLLSETIKTVSQNVRGLNDFKKRKSIFNQVRERGRIL